MFNESNHHSNNMSQCIEDTKKIQSAQKKQTKNVVHEIIAIVLLIGRINIIQFHRQLQKPIILN